jgi:hypothetical protein
MLWVFVLMNNQPRLRNIIIIVTEQRLSGLLLGRVRRERLEQQNHSAPCLQTPIWMVWRFRASFFERVMK